MAIKKVQLAAQPDKVAALLLELGGIRVAAAFVPSAGTLPSGWREGWGHSRHPVLPLALLLLVGAKLPADPV